MLLINNINNNIYWLEIVMGIIGMIDLRTHTSHLKLITADLSSVCGVFGLALS